jgi:hypothetical protein
LDAVTFVSLAPAAEQMARDLYTYKRPNVPPNIRANRTTGLAATLWRWLQAHERCVASACGISTFEVVTTVPSTSGRPCDHPLVSLVSRLVVGSGNRYRDVLSGVVAGRALVRTLPPEQRYSYVYEGNSQVLDHVLISAGPRRVGYDIVHINAEFAEQASDHDPQVVRFIPR